MRNFKRISVALCLLLSMLCSLLLLASCKGKDEGFDFLTEDMSKYIKLPAEHYKGVALTVPDVEKVTEQTVDQYVLSALVNYYTKTAKTITLENEGTIAEGDTVLIYYRGEINMAGENEPEKWVDFIGGCNFYPQSSTTEASATSLLIGSGSMIAGFEDALVGIAIDTSKLVTLQGKDKQLGVDGNIAHISYTYSYTDANGNQKNGTMYDRIDLTKNGDDYVDAGRYSDTLRLALEGKKNGGHTGTTVFTETFDITGDLVEEEVKISNVSVKKIVKVDNPLDNKTDPTLPYTFSLKFPDKYSSNKALQGKEARWYVYATQITRIDPEKASLDDVPYAFVSDKTNGLGITYDSISHLLTEEEAKVTTDGGKQELVMEYYREYVKGGLEESYEKQRQANVIDTLWKEIADKVEWVNKPTDLIDAYVEQLRASAESAYEEYLTTEGNGLYKSLEEFVAGEYDDEYFPKADAVEAGFYRMAEDQLKQELAIHYIAKAEGVKMSKKREQKYFDEQIASILASANQQNTSG